MSEWTGRDRARCHARMDKRLQGRAGVVSLNEDQLALLGCLGALAEMEEALRDAEAVDNCRHTSGGDGDTYEAIKARRRAVLAKYRLPVEENDGQ